MIKIKSDEELFKRWMVMGAKVASQRGIIQNDIETDISEIKEWLENCQSVVEEMTELINDTFNHISKES